MKTLIAVLALAGAYGVALAEERSVVAPTDNKPFTVEKDVLVRLTGKGITGSNVTVQVQGPAKVVATSDIRELVNGQPIKGNTI